MKNNIVTTLAVGFARLSSEELQRLLDSHKVAPLTDEQRAAIRRVLAFRNRGTN